jgi:hypothetical protein
MPDAIAKLAVQTEHVSLQDGEGKKVTSKDDL